MAPLEVLLTVFASTFAVAWRRVRRGRLRPTWSFVYEVTCLVMKREFARLARRSFPAQRAGWDARAMPDPTRRRVRLEERAIGGVPCAVVTPTSAPADRTLLYLHGGAYIFGSIATNRELMGRLALAAHARVVAPLYRLAPEH